MHVGCGGIFNYHYGTDLLIVITNMVLSKFVVYSICVSLLVIYLRHIHRNSFQPWLRPCLKKSNPV